MAGTNEQTIQIDMLLVLYAEISMRKTDNDLCFDHIMLKMCKTEKALQNLKNYKTYLVGKVIGG